MTAPNVVNISLAWLVTSSSIGRQAKKREQAVTVSVLTCFFGYAGLRAVRWFARDWLQLEVVERPVARNGLFHQCQFAPQRIEEECAVSTA